MPFMANQLKLANIIFGVGDTIAVSAKVKEGDKERLQVFEGVVIAIRGRGETKSFVVRKLTSAIGIERIWPVNCPSIASIKLIKSQPTRRAKLYYLRDRIGRLALKIDEKGTKREIMKEVVVKKEAKTPEAPKAAPVK